MRTNSNLEKLQSSLKAEHRFSTPGSTCFF